MENGKPEADIFPAEGRTGSVKKYFEDLYFWQK